MNFSGSNNKKKCRTVEMRPCEVFFFFFFFPQIVKMWSSHYHAINMTMVPRTVCHIHHRIEIKQSDSALSPQFELNMKFINLKINKTDTSTGEIEV